MPLTPRQRARVLSSLASGRLPLERPNRMYAGFGDGLECDGCGETIDQTQVEYETTYDDGRSYRLHLGCAGLWDAEQVRLARSAANDGAARLTTEQTHAASKKSADLRERDDLPSREAEASIEESLQIKRGDPPTND